MFTSNQIKILRILADPSAQPLTMTELGRRLGKAPGAFQRGLNALEAEGLIVSRRQGRRRLLSLSAGRSRRLAVAALLESRDTPLPADVYAGFYGNGRRAPARLAEPPGVYADSALKFLLIAEEER